MRPTAILTLLLSAATLTASAAEEVSVGEVYTYLAIELTNGTSQTLPAEGLIISYAEGVMTAENGSEKVIVPLASLSRMFFTNTATDGDITTTGISDAKRLINNEENTNNILGGKLGEVYDLSGRQVGSQTSTDVHLNKGVYVVRKNGEVRKIQVK